MTKKQETKKQETKKVEAQKINARLLQNAIQEQKISDKERQEREHILAHNDLVNRKTKVTKVLKPSRTIVTRSVNDKFQQRSLGSRVNRNKYTHFENTIGHKIDSLIEQNNFTKKQIEVFAATKMSKVNSHIAHLRRDIKVDVVIDSKTKIVRFA